MAHRSALTTLPVISAWSTGPLAPATVGPAGVTTRSISAQAASSAAATIARPNVFMAFLRSLAGADVTRLIPVGVSLGKPRSAREAATKRPRRPRRVRDD